MTNKAASPNRALLARTYSIQLIGVGTVVVNAKTHWRRTVAKYKAPSVAEIVGSPKACHLIFAHIRLCQGYPMPSTKLSFALNEEDDILNTTIRDSYTGSVTYIVETPKYVGGTLTTTVTRRNQVDGSMRLAFKILWKVGGVAKEDVKIVLDNMTSQEVPVREILENALGSTT